MTQKDKDRIQIIEDWIELHKCCIRDLENEKNVIILQSMRKEKNNE